MFFDLINIFILSIIFPLSFCECDLDTPINKNGVCNLTYCTEDEFEDGTCSIDNDIIKTQWLNNIILFNDYKYRYCCFSINSKGDMIAEYSTEEKNGIRLFYGLKQDGNFFFKNSNDSNIPTKIVTIKDKDGNFSIRYESNSLFVSVNNISDTNEYLIGISLYYGNVELFNLESNNESFIQTQNFTGYVIYSTLNQLIKLEYYDNNYNENYNMGYNNYGNSNYNNYEENCNYQNNNFDNNMEEGVVKVQSSEKIVEENGMRKKIVKVTKFFQNGETKTEKFEQDI